MATKPLNPIQITRDYVKNLKDKIRVEKTILFGSSARDEMNQDSDLDIIIISPDFKKMKYIDRLILLSKARGNQFTFIPMDILGYTNEEFEKMAKESVVLGEAQKEGKEISFKQHGNKKPPMGLASGYCKTIIIITNWMLFVKSQSCPIQDEHEIDASSNAK